MRIGAVLALVAVTIACGGRLFPEYEYEEDVYLSLDGSATIYVNGSVPALNALRGASFDPRPNARLDKAAIRAYFTSPVTRVTRLPRTSRRNNRQFVHVRLDVDDVRRLGEAAPFAWSSYQFTNAGDAATYRQSIGPPAGQALGPGRWTGDELVAFRLHIPSQITYHNAGDDNPQRGNILVWHQRLTDRLGGAPLMLDARMEPRSILYRTLWLFGASAVGVATMFALVIWWISRRGTAEELRAEG